MAVTSGPSDQEKLRPDLASPPPLPRSGLRPPRKSELSVWRWQLRLVRPILLMVASTFYKVNIRSVDIGVGFKTKIILVKGQYNKSRRYGNADRAYASVRVTCDLVRELGKV